MSHQEQSIATTTEERFPSPGGEGQGEGGITPSVVSHGGMFTVPVDEEFYQLPAELRKEVRTWLTLLKEIDSAPKIKPACKYHATRLQGKRGFTAGSIRRHYYAYIKTGDWRELVDLAKLGASSSGRHASALPNAFVEFWKKLCEENQRKDAPAWRELKQIWRTGYDSNGKQYKTIPGYGSPGGPHASVPRGWSYANLNRYTPTRQEKTITRVGPVAASNLRIKVLTSREGLRVGQYIEFDDQVYDQKVNFFGRTQSRAMRPLGFNALDLLSACCISYSFKPTIWNPEREAKEQLKEIDFMWFVVHLLLTKGYRADDLGTKFIVEHGTAAISEAFEKRIFDVTGGKVTIDRSGITGDPAYAGMFEGARKGNFRFKGAIESFFNLVRNETAMLPGQVGKDRDHSPEQMHGLERYNNQLLQVVQELTPEEAAQIKFPVLEWSQWIGRVMKLYERINWRTDHALQGWRKLNFVTTEWQLPAPGRAKLPLSPDQFPTSAFSEQWFHMEQFLALPVAQQELLRGLLESDPSLTRVRQLSPQEVWNSQSRELTLLQSFKLPDLLGPEAGVERTVKGNTIEFDDQEIDTEPLIFDAPGLDGQTFLTYINPFEPSALILCDRRGAYVGTIPRTQTPSRADLAAIAREMGKARHHESEVMKAVGLRHIDQAQAKLKMHQANAAVLQNRTKKQQTQHDDLVAFAKAALSKPNTPQ